MERTLVYFVSDVHLGLKEADPSEREERFLRFLGTIPDDALALYLLGDIWDFWYEYRDVVPREGARVLARLISLAAAGVQVCFIPGNHDLWSRDFFDSVGIRRVEQPLSVRLGDRTFCLGHGDALGGSSFRYGLTLKVFRSRLARRLFSTLHPWIAFRIAGAWSGGGRKRHAGYVFKGDESEPLYRFALGREEDYCIFGHFHQGLDAALPGGRRLVILEDWIGGGQPHAVFDTATSSFSVSPRSAGVRPE